MQRSLLPSWSLVFIFCLFVFGEAASGAEPYFEKDSTEGLGIPDVVARVNGVEINSKFVKFEFNRVVKLVKKKIDKKQSIEIIRDIVDKEIVREILYQKGQGKDQQVSKDVVNEELEKLKAGYANEAEFNKALEQRGIDLDEIKKSIEIDTVSHSILRKQVEGQIDIDDKSVQKFYDDNKESFFRPEAFRVQHIFMFHFPPDKLKSVAPEELEAKREEHSKEARKRIDLVLEEAKGGADFDALAKKYSEDLASVNSGGDLDFIYKGVFPGEFDAAVGALKPGETSGVVETGFGYHIIKLNEVKAAEYAPFEDVKGSIQRYLYTQEAKTLIAKYLEDIKKNAKVEIYY